MGKISTKLLIKIENGIEWAGADMCVRRKVLVSVGYESRLILGGYQNFIDFDPLFMAPEHDTHITL